MKTKILPLILLATAPVAFAQETPTYTDLYYAGDMSVSPWGDTTRYLCDAESWNVGSLEGETFTESPNNKYNNLFIVGTLETSSTNPTGYDFVNWEVNNVTFDVKTKVQHSLIQVCGGGQSFKINGDLTASIDNAWDWNNTSTNIQLQGASSLEIVGNLYINNKTDPTKRTYGDANYAGILHNNGIHFSIDTEVSLKIDKPSGAILNATCDSTFILNGDVIMSDLDINSEYKPWGAKYSNSRITFRIDTIISEIKGVVHMDESYAGERVLDLCSRLLSGAESIGITFDEVSRTFGGLNGTGALVSSAARKKIVDIIFTNSDKYEWSGSVSAAHEETEFSLLMDAQAKDGKQALFVESSHAGQASFKTSFKSVTVANGTLELGGYSELVNGSLAITGSSAKFVLGGAGKDTLGVVNFSSANITAGTLTVGFNQESSDVLNIVKGESEEANGTFYVADPSAFAIELDYLPVEDSALKEQLESEGSFTYDIITFDSTNLTAETLSNITVKVVDQSGNVINGVDAALSFIGEEGAYTGIAATITSAVPEPATVAGIAGMLALAFVAYRRRK